MGRWQQPQPGSPSHGGGGWQGQKCPQAASLETSPPALLRKPFPGNAPIILSHLPSVHYSYPPGSCVHSLHCNDSLCRSVCFCTSVFMSSVCMREVYGLYVYVRAHEVTCCACARSWLDSDRHLLPHRGGGFSPSSRGMGARAWVLGGARDEREGGKERGRQSKMMTVLGRVCSAPQPPVRECRRSILDNCFVYGITNNWFDYFFPAN